MFDMNVVAKNIRKARTRKNMTQLNLADEMGVSYQAVSNWERGNSMPDISNIPELCEILEISFEELVGGKSKESEITQKIIADEEVSLEEISQVAPIVKPEVIEEKAHGSSLPLGKQTAYPGGVVGFQQLFQPTAGRVAVFRLTVQAEIGARLLALQFHAQRDLIGGHAASTFLTQMLSHGCSPACSERPGSHGRE